LADGKKQDLAKLIGRNPVRRLGMMSLGPVLSVLGIKLAMIEDPEALERYGSQRRLPPIRLALAPPVARKRCDHFTTLATLTLYVPATWRQLFASRNQGN
jgi:hypothetical protein